MPLSDANHEQFLRLFAEHEPAIRAFARLLLQRREDVSGVMQDATVTLWQKFDSFDPSQDFRKWAFGIVRFKVLAHLRDLSRSRYVFDDELVNRLADEASASEQRHDAQREALELCLQKLPAPQRDLILAAYEKGTRMDELAAWRGETAMSLYKKLQRLRQGLLECVRRAITQEGIA
jgi:RNA polymerase sigma-70 factor (ECF subfamily)